MTAVEWLFDRMVGLAEDYDDGKINYTNYINGVKHFLDQAKEMEKQQITEAFDEGQEYEYQYHINNAPKFDSQTYYNETYGSNGSDEQLKTK